MIKWLRGLFDPPRFCQCGLEVCIAAKPKRDSKTGEITGYRWSGACPKSNAHIMAHGHGLEGNGYLLEHTHWYGYSAPSWLGRHIREFIEEEWDGYGSLMTSATEWEAKDDYWESV
jgi:hypothetical protein